jgi:hypothetical protein
MANRSRAVELLDGEWMAFKGLLRSQTSACGLAERLKALW